MIVFEPSGGSFWITHDQLDTVLELIGSEDARVVEHDAAIEVYVGERYVETLRHHVDMAGHVFLTELDVNADRRDECGDPLEADWVSVEKVVSA